MKFIKQNIKKFAAKGLELGVETVTQGTKGIIDCIFYKIIFTVILIACLLIGGCVGSNLIINSINSPVTVSTSK